VLKNSSTEAYQVQVCTGDLSRAGRFGRVDSRTMNEIEAIRALAGASGRGWDEAGQSVRQICIVASIDSVGRSPAFVRAGVQSSAGLPSIQEKVVAPHALCLADHPASIGSMRRDRAQGFSTACQIGRSSDRPES
jgi:hypothetical protein